MTCHISYLFIFVIVQYEEKKSFSLWSSLSYGGSLVKIQYRYFNLTFFYVDEYFDIEYKKKRRNDSPLYKHLLNSAIKAN